MGIDTLKVVATRANNRAQFDNFIVTEATTVPEITLFLIFGLGLARLVFSRKIKRLIIPNKLASTRS